MSRCPMVPPLNAQRKNHNLQKCAKKSFLSLPLPLVRARPELVRRRQQQQPKKVKKEQESQFTPQTAIFSYGGLNTIKTINNNSSSNNSSNSNSNETESEMWIGLAAPPVNVRTISDKRNLWQIGKLAWTAARASLFFCQNMTLRRRKQGRRNAFE